MDTVYSMEDVSKHNKKEDMWLAIHNKVYNVTDFIKEHPGGEEVLIDEAGKDATEAFEDIGHSDEAREILEKYVVGNLHPDDKKAAQASAPAAAPAEKPKNKCVFRLLLPAAIIVGIVAYKFILGPRRN